MSGVAIVVGGVGWLLVVLTLFGYCMIHAYARNWPAAAVSFVCALFVAALGAMSVLYTPGLAERF